MSAVSLPDAKTHLNMFDASKDVELQTFIDAAEAAVTAKIGPLTVVSKTSRVRGYTRSLRLPFFPVASITSVTPVGGAALDIATLQFVPDSTRLIEYIVTGGYFASPWYDVVYSAGRAVTASTFADIYKGVLELIRQLWADSQRGKAASRPGAPTRSQSRGMAYEWPDTVNALLGPYLPLAVA